MSRRSDAKQARRRKRKAARDARWIPEADYDEIFDIGARAELFDALLLERGWTFDDVHSDDGLAAWFYEPSGVAGVGDDVEGVTRIWFTYTVDAEPDESTDDFPDVVHVVLVGTADDYQFNDAELLESLDVVEAHRLGDPAPVFAG